ncbi:MAG: DUF4198 domain-containing protein [Anaerolineae bacterium]|nr:DUF4198 domain-containing protein [Gemmatimonadaceae bacterium]
MKKTRTAAITLALLVATAAALAAHDLFLKLDEYWVAPNTAVRIPLLNGTFRKSENSVTRDRVRDVSVVASSGIQHLSDFDWKDTSDTTYLGIRTGAPGTYVIGVSTNPKDLKLSGKDFNGYLREEGLNDVVEMRRKKGELGKESSERYAKHVKAVFQVGTEKSEAYKTPLGYPAEIVPLGNPYDMRVGSVLEVQCLVDGSPASNIVVLSGGQAGAKRLPPRQVRSDSNGIARIRITSRGRWYVKFISIREMDEPDINYESKWATLTFGVR